MTRISKKFKELRKKGIKALIPFITAGDPSLTVTEKLVTTLEEAGADIIELGVPFSDPMADGPVIQAASERALKNKVTVSDVLSLVARIRKKSQIPLLLMGYYNPIFVMGHERFSQKAKEVGVDAVLIVDLPPEEAGDLRKVLKKNNIDLVHLLAPTSNEERIKRAVRSASGFIYYVSLTGITGARLTVSGEIRQQIEKIRNFTQLPIAVGFGISKPEQACQLGPVADGIVVGSALVKIIARKGRQKSLFANTSRFVSSLKRAIG